MTDSSHTGSGPRSRRPRVAGLRKRDARNTPSAGETNGSSEQPEENLEDGQNPENGENQLPSTSSAPSTTRGGAPGGREADSGISSGSSGASAEGAAGGDGASGSEDEASISEAASSESSSAETSAAGTSTGEVSAGEGVAEQAREPETRTLDASSLPDSESSAANATSSGAETATTGLAADDQASGTTGKSGAAGKSGESEEEGESEPTVVIRDGVVGVDESGSSADSGSMGEPGSSDASGSVSESESAAETSEFGEAGSERATSDRNEGATPRGKARGSDPAPMSEVGTSRSGSRPVRLGGPAALTAVLLIAAVLFGGLAFFFRQAMPATGEGADNEALVDTAATSEVNGQAKEAVSKVFSYDFANTAKTEDAAKNLLVGPASKQYEQLFSTVKEQAPQQKLLVTTSVKESGVKRLQGDRAEVLLFVNQNATRTETKENSVGQAQVSLGMVKQGDQWKINSITQR